MKEKYIQEQSYCECQLVSAINAHIFYGGDKIQGEEYQRLVDLVKARYGSALSIEKAHEYLNIERKPLSILTFDILRACLEIGLPVELSVFPPKASYHSILAVAVVKDVIEVTNLYQGKYLKWIELKKMLNRHPNTQFAIIKKTTRHQ